MHSFHSTDHAVNAALLSKAAVLKKKKNFFKSGPKSNVQSSKFKRNFSTPSDAAITINQKDILLYFSPPSLSPAHLCRQTWLVTLSVFLSVPATQSYCQTRTKAKNHAPGQIDRV